MNPLKVLDQVVSSSPLQNTLQALATIDIRAPDVVSHRAPSSTIWTGSTAHHSYSATDFIFPLLDVPTEIRSCIYKHAVASKQRINITISKNRRVLMGTRRPYFNYCVRIGNINLLLACSLVHDECIAALWSHNHFFSHHSASIQKLPTILTEHNTNLIQTMELDIDFHMRTQPNERWPRKLDFFCTKMPHLKRFKMVSTFNPDILMAEAPGDSRTGQEVRALISFSAFLVKRHPRLELMYWPADSGVRAEYSSKVRVYVDLVAFPLARPRVEPVIRSLTDEDEMMTKVEDMRLNSTAIRRLAWNNPELCIEFPTAFEIDAATSTNAPEPEPGRYSTRDCAIIDQAAYVSPGMYHRLSNKILAKCPRTPKIYEVAEENVVKREQAAKAAKAREERDEAAKQGAKTQAHEGPVNKWQVPQTAHRRVLASRAGRGGSGLVGNSTSIDNGEGSNSGANHRGGRESRGGRGRGGSIRGGTNRGNGNRGGGNHGNSDRGSGSRRAPNTQVHGSSGGGGTEVARGSHGRGDGGRLQGNWRRGRGGTGSS